MLGSVPCIGATLTVLWRLIAGLHAQTGSDVGLHNFVAGTLCLRQ